MPCPRVRAETLHVSCHRLRRYDANAVDNYITFGSQAAYVAAQNAGAMLGLNSLSTQVCFDSMVNSALGLSRGTAASVTSSVLFGLIYFLTPSLAPMSAEGIWAFRVLITVPFIAIVLLGMKQWNLVSEVWARVEQRPSLFLGVVGSGALLGVLLWLFGWAPLHGRGLQVALGFFLFPLVLVILGKFIYKDTLKWWHWCATGAAATGVALQVFFVGGLSWETIVVTLGYPLYFVIRRALGMSHPGGMFWEFLVALPVAAVFLSIEVGATSTFETNPSLWWFAPLFALISAVAFWMFILAAKLLPMSILGLLTYLEPALLVVASLLIGERIARLEYVSYSFIWIAVLIILVSGIVQYLQGPKPGGSSSEPNARLARK